MKKMLTVFVFFALLTGPMAKATGVYECDIDNEENELCGKTGFVLAGVYNWRLGLGANPSNACQKMGQKSWFRTLTSFEIMGSFYCVNRTFLIVRLLEGETNKVYVVQKKDVFLND